jgi:hypothetical protein
MSWEGSGGKSRQKEMTCLPGIRIYTSLLKKFLLMILYGDGDDYEEIKKESTPIPTSPFLKFERCHNESECHTRI